MNWFSRFSSQPSAESILCIDIGASAVAGAYAHFTGEGAPVLVYSKRIPVTPHENESGAEALTRALESLCELLIREGAPALGRIAGHARADAIMVAISAPWQHTTLRHEKFEDKTPFIFTRKMLRSALAQATACEPGKLLVDESIVGTMLNGYETHEPFGKRAARAQVLILASCIDEAVARRIAAVLRTHFHAEKILSIAGSSLRYQAIREVFPHDKNAFIVDASGAEIVISLIRRGLLVAVRELPMRDVGSAEWQTQIHTAFAEFAKKYPLPRILFILADMKSLPLLRTAVQNPEIANMWLTEDPPKLVEVKPSAFAPQRIKSEGEVDTVLALMALYWQTHGHDE